jgi:hypothetical protein
MTKSLFIRREARGQTTMFPMTLGELISESEFKSKPKLSAQLEHPPEKRRIRGADAKMAHGLIKG